MDENEKVATVATDGAGDDLARRLADVEARLNAIANDVLGPMEARLAALETLCEGGCAQVKARK